MGSGFRPIQSGEQFSPALPRLNRPPWLPLMLYLFIANSRPETRMLLVCWVGRSDRVALVAERYELCVL